MATASWCGRRARRFGASAEGTLLSSSAPHRLPVRRRRAVRALGRGLIWLQRAPGTRGFSSGVTRRRFRSGRTCMLCRPSRSWSPSRRSARPPKPLPQQRIFAGRAAQLRVAGSLPRSAPDKSLCRLRALRLPTLSQALPRRRSFSERARRRWPECFATWRIS